MFPLKFNSPQVKRNLSLVQQISRVISGVAKQFKAEFFRLFRRWGGPLCPHKKKKVFQEMRKGKGNLKSGCGVKSHLQKLIFNNSGQILQKSRYQSFLNLPSFT